MKINKLIDLLEEKGYVTNLFEYINDYDKYDLEIIINTPSGGSENRLIEGRYSYDDLEEIKTQIEDWYEDFEIEDYVWNWLEAKRNGTNGVPGIVELFNDATYIEEKLKELTNLLSEFFKNKKEKKNG